MKALLITAEGINAIEIDNTLAAMYDAIGCEVITAAGSPAPGHVAWVDDNGALTVKEGTQAASAPWHGDILFGRILVTAIDEEGDTADATIDPDVLRRDLYVGSLQMFNGTLTPVLKPMTTLEENAQYYPEELESDQAMPDLKQVRWDDNAQTIREKIAAALEHTASDPRMKAEEATATLLTSVMFDLDAPEQAATAHRVLLEHVLPAMIDLAKEVGLAVADLSEWTIGMDDETDAAVSLRITLIPEVARDRYIACLSVPA
jgi:hypothetical protein